MRHAFRLQVRDWSGSWWTYRNVWSREEADTLFFQLKGSWPLVRMVQDGLTLASHDASRDEERAS